MFLRRLGIFGCKEADENLVLASLLTGDPLLLIGNHGCAKTHVANVNCSRSGLSASLSRKWRKRNGTLLVSC